MADFNNEFTAEQERQMRSEGRRGRNPDTMMFRQRRDSLAAQKARQDAADTMRRSRSMPDNFPVPQYGEQED